MSSAKTVTPPPCQVIVCKRCGSEIARTPMLKRAPTVYTICRSCLQRERMEMGLPALP